MPLTWPRSSIHNSKPTNFQWYCYRPVIEYILDVRDKLKLVETLISELPDGHEETVERGMKLWWYNIRKEGGLRLTDIGYFVLKNMLEIESYDMTINIEEFDRQMLLDLDRKLQMPYYIVVKKKLPITIVMFGSREAVLARLYGSLDKFLDNYN